MKFGIVGVIAFIIDWGILNILVGAFHMHNVLAATISFEALKTAYGKAISAVPGKSEGWLMCPFEDNMPIYFGGDDSKPAAYVEVNVFGRSVPGSAWEKLTEQIMAALGKELGIPADRTYIRYTATTDWGWNGGRVVDTETCVWMTGIAAPCNR